MQEETQLPTTPPLSGADLVTKTNAALQTVGSDFYGNADPMSKAWPGSVWAHPAEGVYKRLNDAGSAWVVEGRLFKANLPMYAEADIPLTDIGDIHVIGKGPYSWDGSSYGPALAYDNSTSGLVADDVQGAIDEIDASIDFTIIYPNGGSAGSPANVAINTRYVETNPFPGHYVICQAQLLIGGRWINPGWGGAGATPIAWGTTASFDGTDLVVQTAISAMTTNSVYTGGSMPGTPGTISTPIPCRVLVWKLTGAI
jgi:hypothetical protein